MKVFLKNKESENLGVIGKEYGETYLELSEDKTAMLLKCIPNDTGIPFTITEFPIKE